MLHPIQSHHHLLTIITRSILIVTLLTFFLSRDHVYSESSSSLATPTTTITTTPTTTTTNSEPISMAICRMRGTLHLPSLHGTFYFTVPWTSSRQQQQQFNSGSSSGDTSQFLLYINGSIIGFNTLEFSKRSLPLHIHEFGNILENDGMSVGGHLEMNSKDVGATLSPLSIQDTLKVNYILSFQQYSHASSVLSLEDIIGRSMIVHHFENNGTMRIGQCVIAVLPTTTSSSSISTTTSTTTSRSSSTTTSDSSSSISTTTLSSGNAIDHLSPQWSSKSSSMESSTTSFNKLVAHVKGTNPFSQPVNGTVIIESVNIPQKDQQDSLSSSSSFNMYLKMCHLNSALLHDTSLSNMVISIHEGGDISKLGVPIMEMDYHPPQSIINSQQFTFSSPQFNSLKQIAGRAFSISLKQSKQLLAWGTLGIAPSNLNPKLTLEHRTCESNEIKQDLTFTVNPTVKSRFYSKIRIENQDANTGVIHEFSGFLLFDYLKRKVYAKAQSQMNSNRTYELVVIPNYFTKFLSVYLLVDSKCLFLTSQLHLSQIPLELKLQQVSNHPIYQITFKGFAIVNGVHCEEWFIKTRELFGREFDTEISLFTSRNNYHLVKAIISKTPIGSVSIELSQVSELEYPFDDQLEEWTQQASVKCRYGNTIMLRSSSNKF